MNRPGSIGDKLAALNALRAAPVTDESLAMLRQALTDRSNRIVARAADVAGDTATAELVPDLLNAHRRLTINPLKKDPGCLGKTAIVRALVKLGYDDVEIYRNGISYQQPDPVWGGEKDAAAELRGVCALGLVGCASRLEVLNRCAILLADPSVEARTAAAQAISALRQPEGGPVLRLKILTGDKSPVVIGECCAGLLRLGEPEDVEFVVRLLASENAEVCVQAALALGESRTAQAFEPIRLAWQRQTSVDIREDLLICLGLLRTSQASDFLLSLIHGGDPRVAADAIKALKAYGKSGEIRQRVEAALQAAGDRRLDAAFQEEWGVPP